MSNPDATTRAARPAGLTKQQTHQALDDIAAVTTPLRNHIDRLYELLDNADIDVDIDGYRTNSLGGGNPTNVVETFTNPDGTFTELAVPQHSDPTGNAVLAREQARAFILETIERVTVQIWNALRTLDQSVGNADKIRVATPPIPETPEIWCTSCLRANIHSPRAPKCGTLCRNCAEWRRAQQRSELPPGYQRFELPPVRILEIRAEGRNITSRVLDEVLEELTPTKPTRHSKRRRRR